MEVLNSKRGKCHICVSVLSGHMHSAYIHVLTKFTEELQQKPTIE